MKYLNPGIIYSSSFGPLAQLVEQGPLKPKVAGSNPARPIFRDEKV